jgi:hypothetical protein
MSNSLPTIGRTTAAIAETFRQNKVDPETGGGTPFMSFDSKRTGEWLFGVEKEPCTGETFALDLTTLKHGWVQWHQKKANRRLVPINAAKPERQEDIHYTDSKGRSQVDEANEARSLEGTFEDGTRFLYETNSYGGRKAVDSVLEQLFIRAAQNSPFLFPHVELNSESYDHKEWGKLWNPQLTVTAWYDESGNEEGETATLAAPEQAQEEQADPEPEAPAEAPAATTTRRRRRTAS